MANVLLVILLIISIILIGLILIQRSEGGALGIGGGGGGLMSGRSSTDLIQRLTAIFGGLFLLTCLLISISFNFENRHKGPFDDRAATEELVKDVPAVPDMTKDVDKANKALNPPADSAKDVTPLAGGTKEQNSEAAPKKDEQKKPQ